VVLIMSADLNDPFYFLPFAPNCARSLTDAELQQEIQDRANYENWRYHARHWNGLSNVNSTADWKRIEALGQYAVDTDFQRQEDEAALAAAAREQGEAAVTFAEVLELIAIEYEAQFPQMLLSIDNCDYASLNAFFRRAYERVADQKAEEIRRTVV
jgi:hypothetical protein